MYEWLTDDVGRAITATTTPQQLSAGSRQLGGDGRRCPSWFSALRRRPHWSDERGANLVEFAFVMPILVMIVFGIAEFGFAFNNYISLRNGVREGARQAIVASVGTDSSCTVTGYGGSGDTRRLMCLTKSRIGLDTTKTRIKVYVPSTYAVGQSVMVCAEYPVSSVTKLFQPLLNGKVLKAKSEMRIEQTANPSSDLGTNANETSQSASTPWAGCP